MSFTEKFADIIKFDEPLAPLTWLKVGGPAQMLVEPQSEEQLVDVLKTAHAEEIPVRVLGSGANVLVRQEGVSGIVLRLNADAFKQVSVSGTTIHAGGGAQLSHVITEAVSAGLTGLEELVGIPSTVGGAVKGNAGGRHTDFGEFVTSVDVLTVQGEKFTRTGDELSFEYRGSSVNELLVLSAEIQLKEGDPEEISDRVKTTWIAKKTGQPLSFQSAGCIFKNPRGMRAGELIDQAGLKGTKLGEAEVSERHANFIVTHDGATAKDVLNLIEVIKSRVFEVHNIDLELEIKIW